MKSILLLFGIFLGINYFIGCSSLEFNKSESEMKKYNLITKNKLRDAFILNSSPTFKGYYYEGSDNRYHYFISKWNYQKNKYFKINKKKFIINETFQFEFGKEEIKISLFGSDIIFGYNKFYKLYLIYIYPFPSINKN